MVGVLTGSMLMGCGDTTEAGSALDEQEETALSQALAQSGMLSYEARAHIDALLGQASEIGTVGAFSALASQALITFTLNGERSGPFVVSGVFGWTELDAGRSTLGSAIALETRQELDGFPNSINSIVGSGFQPRFFEGESNSTYIRSAGQFAATTSDFGDLQDCPDIPDGNEYFEFVTCRYSLGTMSGEFNFEAVRVIGTGPATYSQPTLAFDLPAVRLELDIIQTGVVPSIARVR